jgi:glucose-1-phosphate cytidylyltransferase
MISNMKVVILAGGRGTRLSEETEMKPKPMVEIGGKPIIWHIMKAYSKYGINDFIICLGYKGYLIKEYFANYFLHENDVTINLIKNQFEYHQPCNNKTCEPWKITLIDTGLDTLTGSRLKKVKPYLDNKTFMFTYGDGVSDVNIEKLLEFHKSHKKLATLTAVKPTSRFGALSIDSDNIVLEFKEKPEKTDAWVNGGFFVLEPEAINYIKEGDDIPWETTPLEGIAKDKQLMSYKHDGFWQCMDTLNDKNKLNKIWESGNVPWLKD